MGRGRRSRRLNRSIQSMTELDCWNSNSVAPIGAKFMSQLQEATRVTELALLNDRISDLESCQATISQQLASAESAVRKAMFPHRYRRLQQLVRRPGRSFELWPLGLMIVIP